MQNTDNTLEITALRTALETAQAALTQAEANKQELFTQRDTMQRDREKLEEAEKMARKQRFEAEGDRNRLAKLLREAELTLVSCGTAEFDVHCAVLRKRQEQTDLADDLTAADDWIKVGQAEVGRIQQALRDLETAGQRRIRELRQQAATLREEQARLERESDTADSLVREARAYRGSAAMQALMITQATQQQAIIDANGPRILELKAQAEKLEAEAKDLEDSEAAKLGKPVKWVVPTGPVSTAGIYKQLGAGPQKPAAARRG